MRKDYGWALARIAAGLVMAYYGGQKAFGLFGGNGFEATVSGFQKGLGIPPVFAVLAIAGELLGGLGLISGFMTRIAGFGVFCTMAVAMMVNLNKGGLAMLFSGSDPDSTSKVFFTLLIAMVGLAAMLDGGGRFSLDAALNLDEKLMFWKKRTALEGAND